MRMLLSTKSHLPPKLVGEAFYNGEVESELRRIKRMDYCFKQYSDGDACMVMIETVRRCSSYPHDKAKCTTECRERGISLTRNGWVGSRSHYN